MQLTKKLTAYREPYLFVFRSTLHNKLYIQQTKHCSYPLHPQRLLELLNSKYKNGFANNNKSNITKIMCEMKKLKQFISKSL